MKKGLTYEISLGGEILAVTSSDVVANELFNEYYHGGVRYPELLKCTVIDENGHPSEIEPIFVNKMSKKAFSKMVADEVLPTRVRVFAFQVL